MQDPHPPEVSPTSPILQKFQRMLPSLSLPPEQAQILYAVLSGRDVLAMPPLGELRTLYYQVLATLLPEVLLIFSPFIERMKNELVALEMQGISATMLHSGLSDYALAAQKERIRRKHFQIIFLSPGILERPGIRSFFITSTEISLIVVDEAHCFSMHAPGFRPTYFQIPKFLEELARSSTASSVLHTPSPASAERAPASVHPRTHAITSSALKSPVRPPVLALTLPTTRQVEQDIGRALWLPHPSQSVPSLSQDTKSPEALLSSSQDTTPQPALLSSSQDTTPQQALLSSSQDTTPQQALLSSSQDTTPQQASCASSLSLFSSPMMPPLLIRPVLERSNLFLAVHRPQKKVSFLLDFLRRHPHEAGIVYCSEHRLTEHLAQLLNRSGFPALAYHKGLPQAKRIAKLRAFHTGGQILVATPDPSFELNLRDIRFVVHYTLPESLDQYYQEIDRAGRDGLPAKCILLVHAQDLQLLKARFSQATLRFEKTPAAVCEVQHQLESMLHYAFTHQCLRTFLLDYFRRAPALSFDASSSSSNASTLAPASAFPSAAQSSPAASLPQTVNASTLAPASAFLSTAQSSPAASLPSPSSEAHVHVSSSPSSAMPLSYELLTLPARNRVLTSEELPADESLQSIRQYGRHPKNRVEKVSMQLKRAEKQHVFIRYADREFMMNRACKYDHLRKDPWDLATPGLRIQRFRPISIPRDACCINCNPEFLMEKERYGVNAILDRKERVKAQIALDQTDTSMLRKDQLWSAGEELYHFEAAVRERRAGRIMAERAIEYTKVLRSSSKPHRTPAPDFMTADALAVTQKKHAESASPSRYQDGPAMTMEDSLIASPCVSSSEETQNIENAVAAPITSPSISSISQRVQMAKLLEEARKEVSAEVRTQLLGNLKALRQKLAAEQDVPACTIFSNRTLVELCRRLPLTREECAEVYGVGAWKLAHYSDSFLAEIRSALDPHYVADVYEHVSAEITQVPVHAVRRACSEDAVRGPEHTVTYPLSAAVIKQTSECSSELQHSQYPRFTPEAEMLDFLEERYLQPRTKKRIVKKQEFYLTAEEAAAFTCPDGLRAPELAQRLNALVEKSEQISHGSNGVQAATTTQSLLNWDAASINAPISSSMVIPQRTLRAAQETNRAVRGARRKLSGAALERCLTELGYLECCEYTLAGRPRTLYLPGARGVAVGIGRRTRRSAHGLEYPVAVYSSAAAQWIAQLFVRAEDGIKNEDDQEMKSTLQAIEK